MKEFKLRGNEDLKSAKNILSLINLESPFLIRYMNLFNDKDNKLIYVLIDYFDVSFLRNQLNVCKYNL
jgi:hypothetical protein